MARKFTYETTLAFGTDGEPDFRELDVKVSFEVAWGSPESGRGYMADPYLYDPGSPSIVEDVKVIDVEGNTSIAPQFAAEIIQKLEAEHDAMIAEASERENADRDAYEESRWEEAREEARR